MQRGMFCFLQWLILLVGFHQMITVSKAEDWDGCWGECKPEDDFESGTVDKAKCCMEVYSNGIKKLDIFIATEILESVLQETKVEEETSICVGSLVALLQKPPNISRSIEIYANDTQAMSNADVLNRAVRVQLPAELHAEEKNTVVFCMIQLSNQTSMEVMENLYEHRLIGISVGRPVAGLQERINITINVASSINDTLKPKCVFLDTANNLSTKGCKDAEYNQTHITCSCDHLTYFGVLLVSADLSPKDAEILSYITYIGCGISLFALVITVLLFITNRKVRGDDSKKIHISLTVALILLNVHFLPSQAVARTSYNELCLYVALLLHYSLLASFIWMALEGFHLYLLLVKVFNIYVRRYLLKLSVVGWGVPAVIVAVVVIRDKNTYGRTPLDSSTEVCFITDEKVKIVTTVGVFGLVFVFNLIMFGVLIKWFMGPHFSKERRQAERNAAKKKMFTLLVLMVLLGLTWGLIFLSLGYVNTPVLYIFCIVNSLQGLFIFIYFVLTLKNIKESAPMQSTDSQTQSSKT